MTLSSISPGKIEIKMDRPSANHFAQASSVAKSSLPPCEANSSPVHTPRPPRRRIAIHLLSISAMMRTRGGHTDPSASCAAKCIHSQDPSQPSVRRVPPKRARTSGPGETSSQAPTNSQALEDIQRPLGIAPEVIINRPMVTAPPIPGNLDYKVKPFHFELYFDMETMRQKPDLRDSVAMDFYQSMTTQGVQSSTAIRFSIDGCQDILEARHIVEALHIPFHQRIQSSSDSGPLHLRETWSVFYHEGLLEIHVCYHMSYPTEPHLECRHHCREHFTLDQWTQLVERNSAELAPEVAPSKPVSPVLAQPDQAQQDKHPTETIPSTPTAPSMPQAAFTDPPATPPVSLAAPSPS
ncbi:hypothetical protein CK203_110620 [Vitis vinifera]|uniref:Uncharacterized protein n=1 Tax=Vitis vinifera TaxID=29760 RepID=A0A438CB05_VITVI|nr:hypothetical protein CK203_110620 [Vitis vinifera]